MLLFALLTMVTLVGSITEESDVGTSGDSYLNAYAELHNDDVKTIEKRKSSYPEDQINPYPPSQGPIYNSPQGPAYGPPQGPVYGPPQGPVYGSPQGSHQYHQPEYLQPQPNYGPPQYPPAYGQPQYSPVHHQFEPHSLIHGIPYALLGLYDKFKLKLSLITILKLILKFVLFKKFVSFVAIICLLLFIPWLKAKKEIHHHHGGGGDLGGVENDEEDDIMRQFLATFSERQVNSATSFVLNSIAKYENNNAT